MLCFVCGSTEAPGIFQPHHPCHLLDGEPCPPCQEIQELEPQIAQAKDALHRLLVRHRELRTKMNHSHNPIVQELPSEIVSRIFESSVPEQLPEGSSRSLTINEKCSPLILGSVCRAWRQIAFSTPQIWTSLSIYLGNRNRHQPTKAGSTYCELAEEWLSRSGGLPLSVYIYGNENTDGPNVDRLIELVNRHSRRWKHLELDLPYFLASRLCGDSSGISMLQSVRLHCEDESEYQCLDEGSFTMRNTKPSPSFISLAAWPLKKADIEWNDATHVDLAWPGIAECMEVLGRAPQLICFKFTDADHGIIFSNSIPYAFPTTPIIHSLLRELYIGAKDTDLAAKFIDSLILPGLETLTFSSYWPGHLLPTNNFISLVNRSSCLLTTLSIEKESVTNLEIFPLLRAAPSVRNLKFSRLLDAAFLDILETLTLTSGDAIEVEGQILPALETLSFNGKYRSEKPFPWSLVSKIFGRLSEIQSPDRRPLWKFDMLFKMEFNSFLYIDEESVHHFLELKEAGIAFNFRIIHEQYIWATGKSHTEEWDLLELSIEHHSQINKPGTSSHLNV